MLLGERDRLARLARGARVVVLRAGDHRKVGERDEHKPFAARLGGRSTAALQLALGVLEIARPQLGDPQVRQRERAQVGLHNAGLEPTAPRQLASRLERGVEIPAHAREVQPHGGERDVEARAALLGHEVARALGGDQARLGRALVAALEHRAGHRQGELGIGVEALARQLIDERPQCCDLALDQQVDPALAREPCGEIPRAGLDGVQEPARVVAVVGEP